MGYNNFNKKFEVFKEKYNKLEEKYYLEMQEYREFKKENFSGVEKFSKLLKIIFRYIGVSVFLTCIIIYALGFLMYIAFIAH